MIKNLPDAKTFLLKIINRTWETGILPKSWKTAIIIPIKKPNKNPFDPSSYRPIALTSCVCKLMEKMINTRLVWYLESENKLSPYQFGFRKNRSTLDPLLRLSNQIQQGFSKQCQRIGVFFDLEKAYDTTWRFGIIQQLNKIGIREEVKFLGMIFDSKLTWTSHIDTLKTKARKSLNILKVISSFSWGADKRSLLMLYNTLCRSKIDYGCQIYSSACKTRLKELDTVHNMGLSICSGAFRTSPVESIYVDSGELPLDLRREELELRLLFKIKTDRKNPAFDIIKNVNGDDFKGSRYSKPLQVRMNEQVEDISIKTQNVFQKWLFHISCRHKEVRFCWVPSHVGIHGKKLADKEAKEAARCNNMPNTKIPHSDMKRIMKSHILKKWQEQWYSPVLANNKKYKNIRNSINPWVSDFNLNRKKQVIRLRIGHSRLTHKFILDSGGAPECAHCGTLMSVEHILVHCPKFLDIKTKYNLHSKSLKEILESIGIKEDQTPDIDALEVDNFKQSISFKDGHYYMKIPWKRDLVDLVPSNLKIALAVAQRVYDKPEQRGLREEYEAVTNNYVILADVMKAFLQIQLHAELHSRHEYESPGDPILQTSELEPFEEASNLEEVISLENDCVAPEPTSLRPSRKTALASRDQNVKLETKIKIGQSIFVAADGSSVS
ncbi:uncharacterized protein LOC143028383 [Oratosquilla oratoria]|uniref:uncharacterized protein LOC143028383 n=1 Tax=Oratosquilla oratoria TaxID=337810 RepID=UPI003F7589C4